MKVRLKMDFVTYIVQKNLQTSLYDDVRKVYPEGTIFEVIEYNKKNHFSNEEITSSVLLRYMGNYLWLSLQEFSILTEEV